MRWSGLTDMARLAHIREQQREWLRDAERDAPKPEPVEPVVFHERSITSSIRLSPEMADYLRSGAMPGLSAS